MEEVRKRILLVFSHFATNINKLSDGDTALRNRLIRQINNGAAITIDTVNVILEKFTSISAEWLLRGKGNMLISDNLPPFHGEESESEEELHVRISKLQVEYDNEVEENQKLLAQLEYMEDYNRRMAVENHNLKKKLSHYEPQDKKAII